MPDISHILRADLTGEQADAALDPCREVLCVACAGSGKSRTLAYRIAFLIAGGVLPERIVAITFTEKAAESIKRRVAEVLAQTGQSVNLLGKMFIGTIHSFCQNILGASDARYRQFDVLDDNKFKLFLMSRYPALGIQNIRTQNSFKYFQTLEEVQKAWNIAMDEGVSLAAITAREPILGGVLEAIQRTLLQDQFLDFSSMIRLVADGSKQPGRIQTRLAQVHHLLVDEYQDVSGAQEELVQAVHSLGGTIFVVGDDDQSIYGFRGAHVRNILEFTNRYPGAGQHTLSTNFRSTQPIVEVSGSFARQELGAQRLPKDPVADRNPDPRHLGVHHFPTRPVEASWVVDRIQTLLGTEYIERNGTRRGLTPADFAILMSSTKSPEQDGNPRHHAFSSELQSRNIPYTLAAGGSVFDRAQVAALRDTFALFRGGNPDRTASLHVFNTYLLPAFPAADQGQVLQVISAWGRRIHAPTGTTRSRLYPQILLMDLLEALGMKNAFPPDEVMREIGLFSRMLQDIESVYMSVDSAYRFQDVVNYLDNVAEDGYSLSTEDVTMRPDAVTISTVHQMKGLEFPVVFVVDVEPGRFPNRNSSYSGLIPINMIAAAIQGGAYQGSSFSQARLFYTALTRAERYLYVTGSANLPGGKRVYPPSLFANRLVHPELVSDQTQLPPGLVTAPPATRSDDNTLPTSFSDVKYYLKCPMDYRFRKSFGFSPEIAELFGYGRVVHVAIEKLHEEFPTTTPAQADARRVVQENFHLKHVAPSRTGNPGPYERAQSKAEEIAVEYVTRFADDFSHRRQVEARFEIPADHCLITGSIDLLLHEDDHGTVIESQVLDFKTMEGGKDPEHNPKLDWTELSLQVQLYAKAAREVLQEPATAGAIHLLKDNQRIAIPVDDEAVEIAVENVVWAVAGILARDFPMRPEPTKCQECDFRRICPQLRAEFRAGIAIPRALKTPDGDLPAACLLT